MLQIVQKTALLLWRGWFYTTDVTDIGIQSVKKFQTKTGENDTVEFIEDTTAGLTFAKKDANSKFHYEITYNKPGGLVMPIIVEFTYKDGSTERKTYPAQIWRYNDKEITKTFSSEKEITNIALDPDLETADVDTSNNSFPRKEQTKFTQFKKKMKG